MNTTVVVLGVALIAVIAIAGFIAYTYTGQINELQTRYSNLNATYTGLAVEHQNLTSQHSALTSEHNALQTQFNDLQSAYNILASNYTSLNSQYVFVLNESVTYRNIANMNMTKTLASNETESLIMNVPFDQQGTNFTVPFAGYFTITFNTTYDNPVVWVFADSSALGSQLPNNTYVWNWYRPSGTFDMPVSPGTLYITWVLLSGYQDTMTYSITYHY